jgi:hypothetical protein
MEEADKQFKKHKRTPDQIPLGATVAKKLILLSDGEQNVCNPPYTPISPLVASRQLIKEGVEIYVVGVGPEVQKPSVQEDLKKIASEPHDDYFFLVKDFKELINIINNITHFACSYYECTLGTSEPCHPSENGTMTLQQCNQVCVAPTDSPTDSPTGSPTVTTPAPTDSPTGSPTVSTPAPTDSPTGSPTVTTLPPSKKGALTESPITQSVAPTHVGETESPIGPSTAPTYTGETESPIGPSTAPTVHGGHTIAPTATAGEWQCDIELLSCVKSSTPGVPSFSNKTLCDAKCTTPVPSSLLGIWRGIYIQKEFEVEEVDVKFTKDNYCWIKPQNGAVMSYAVKYDDVGILQFEDSQHNLYSVKYTQGTTYTKEVDLLEMAMGGAGKAAPSSYDAAITDGVSKVYSLARCQDKDCDFSPSDPEKSNTKRAKTAIKTVSAISEAILVSSLDEAKLAVESTYAPTQVGPLCLIKADIMLVLDRSASIDVPDFEQAKTFATEIVNGFNVSKDWVHIGIVDFSTTAHLVNQLSYDEAEIDASIKGISNPSMPADNATSIGGGFKVANDELFKSGRGRSGVKTLIIMVTDGTNNVRSPDPIQASLEAKGNGAEILCLGVGDQISIQALTAYASGEQDVYTAKDFKSLDQYLDKIINRACDTKYVCKNITSTETFDIPDWLDPVQNKTGFCLAAGPDDKNPTSREECEKNCIFVAPPPVKAPPGPVADIYKCNTTYHTCDVVPAGTPGGTSKEACEEMCNPKPPKQLLGIYRGIEIEPGYTEGEYDMLQILPSNSSLAFAYKLKTPGGKVFSGNLSSTGQYTTELTFSGDLDTVGMYVNEAFAFGGETDVYTFIIGKPGLDLPDLPPTVKDAFTSKDFKTYVFWKCASSGACDFSSVTF